MLHWGILQGHVGPGADITEQSAETDVEVISVNNAGTVLFVIFLLTLL